MTVAVEAITRERLARWAADCVRDHATPVALLAVGHDEHAGVLHLYRPDGGPTDAQIGALLRRVAEELMG